MLPGRLGLETARIPYSDRHGLMWLGRGNLVVEDGVLHFLAAGSPAMAAGDYQIPYQNVALILLEPGTTVSHDALRLMARHGTGLAAVGEDGVRLYTAPPLGSNESALARRQAALWSDQKHGRIDVARRMYAWRMGEILPNVKDIAILRGIEGARMRETYRIVAQQYGITWRYRRYDRGNPGQADLPNQAINHAASAVEAAASIAVAATATIPQLGFIHEDAATAFILDVADLYRDDITLPVAFEAVNNFGKLPEITLERHVRRLAGKRFRGRNLISGMIDRIKELFHADDSGSHP